MLKFRNIDATPEDPVEKWGVMGILSAFERGGVEDWRKIWRSVNADRSQKVAAAVAHVKGMLESGDVG
ncbi:MAG: hypothetical protein LBB74_07365, partial [Chitinispirillales bacterium]|nr:hypothetical protein [Chitinispirillales bacterium]